MSSATPPKLEGYRVLGELGRGGFGIVYKAHQLVLNRPVAIKALKNLDLTENPDLMERLMREAQVVAHMGAHENIAQVYDVKLFGGMPCLIMEFIEGDSLDRVIAAQGGRLRLPRAVEVVRQTARGLGHAHARGVVHRDVKPENIMVEPDWRVKVMDFGIARSLGTSRITKTGLVVGTPYYMSPEQWQGTGDVDARSDLYSLGIVLYHLVAGRLPFEDDDPFSLGYKHISAPPPPPSSINPSAPPALEKIILKAIRKEPAARYQSAREFEDALVRFAEQKDAATELAPAVSSGMDLDRTNLMARPADEEDIPNASHEIPPLPLGSPQPSAPARKRYDKDQRILQTQPIPSDAIPTTPQQTPGHHRVPTNMSVIPISGDSAPDFYTGGARASGRAGERPPRRKRHWLARTLLWLFFLAFALVGGLAALYWFKPSEFAQLARLADPRADQAIAFLDELTGRSSSAAAGPGDPADPRERGPGGESVRRARQHMDSGRYLEALEELRRAEDEGASDLRELVDRAERGIRASGREVPPRPEPPAETPAPSATAPSSPRGDEPSAPFAFPSRPLLAVADFLAPEDAQPGLGASLAVGLLPDLGSSRVRLAQRPRLERLLSERGLAMADLASGNREAAVAFGRGAGARYIVTGAASYRNRVWRLEASLLDAATGQVAATARVSAPTPDALRRRLPELAGELAKAVR